MRGWKFVALIAVLISAVSIYQLSFTFKSNSVDDAAEQFARIEAENAFEFNNSINKDSVFKASKRDYIDSLWDQEVYLGFPLKKVKQYALNLGLDLQGGTNVTVIVSPEDIIKSLSGNSTDPIFNDALNSAKQLVKSRPESFKDVFYSEWQRLSDNRPLNEVFLSPENQNITLETKDSEILDIIQEESDEALNRSVITLRSRIDKFGATNPIIRPIPATGRIEIELPGLDNEEQIRQQVEAVAKLEFVLPYDQQKAGQVFGDLFVAFRDAKKAELKARGTADSLLVDSLIVSDFQEVFIPYQSVLLVRSKDVDKATALLASSTAKSVMPADVTLMFNKDQTVQLEDGSTARTMNFMSKGTEAPVALDGEYVASSQVSRDESGRVAISMTFTPEGAIKWGDLTEQNIDKPVAIVLDDEIYSMPYIRERMNTGSCQISSPGGFKFEEANTIVNILKAGKLPAPTIVERLTKIGSSLGDQAIKQGLFSLLAGLGLVILFMFIYYGKGGLVANVALLFNIFFIIGILATPAFGVTLTLPGIAGIVLTIGMSIDANVLIFERIREELAVGKKPEQAIESGYGKAFWTIFDANITTFLSAMVLYAFGTGLVKGFAVTLMIGVVCSFFAAVFITRLIIFLLGRKNNYEKMNFSTAFSNKLFRNINIDFISKRKIGYIFSAIVLAVGLGLIAKDGLNLGVAFKGGNSFVFAFEQPVSVADAKASIQQEVGEADVEVKTYDTDNQLYVSTSYLVDSNEPDASQLAKAAVTKAMDRLGKSEMVLAAEMGASFANDVKRTSFTAVMIALVVIFAYIVIRFRKWQFGLGSLVALFHDVLFVLSVFAIARALGFSFAIDEVFIASVLTLVGYSINDTVVVFDRVREYLGIWTSTDSLKDTLNKSLSNTLSRTVMTSVTTLIVVLVLLIFGGETLRGFSFALFVGVLVGTYSSIFIATPIVYDTIKKDE